ncbi:uncharacterized protein F4822DRAFT_79311 [Hypoxylon trugodes]|uniref:uncharacterized protein n=1 Tax=Hypoxylon trugodes TaxID=326681 RepID=UPI00219B366E|nr:uncharacterized protein F4822DRAFT_79311 [Hypoxylon trugodes]KAI1383488.1 hypothetical protein F4822DRAFT_79311 [Hypoxylon trugodes]
MCFIEYVGYTCGHTCVPVKRPCPMTTQQFNFPCCAHAATKPILYPEMCPSCMRILHGRWIDILENEHRFMHARGACTCDVKFPYLQEPRIISQDTVVADQASECSSVTVTNCMPTSQVGDAGSSASAFLSADTDRKGKKPMSEFTLSPVASHFTPSLGSHLADIQYPPYELQGSAAPSEYIGDSTAASSFTPGNTEREPRPSPSSSKGTRRKGKKSRGKNISGSSNARPSDPASPYRQSINEEPQSFQHQQLQQLQHHEKSQKSPQRGRRTSSSSHRKSKLAPLHEELVLDTPSYYGAPVPAFTSTLTPEATLVAYAGDGGEFSRDTSRLPISVSVRSRSLYGAEWLTDHAELHRQGHCECDIRFDKYRLSDEHAAMLQEQWNLEESTANAYTSFDSARPSTAPGGYMSTGSFSGGNGGCGGVNGDNANNPKNIVIVSSDSAQAQSSALSSTRVPAATTTAEEQDSQAAFPSYSSFLQEYPILTPDPSLPSHASYQSARWGYSAYDTSDLNNTSQDPTTGAEYFDRSPRPVDMQTWQYEVNKVPIAGLPIGAGPEGTSHMAPFTTCELNRQLYPQGPDHHQSASR